mgnify:CR=1 FL=1
MFDNLWQHGEKYDLIICALILEQYKTGKLNIDHLLCLGYQSTIKLHTTTKLN